jgi:hypothetical protein
LPVADIYQALLRNPGFVHALAHERGKPGLAISAHCRVGGLNLLDGLQPFVKLRYVPSHYNAFSRARKAQVALF